MRPNQCNKCLHIAITFKQNELERPGWAQIIAYEKSFSDLMYFLKIDSPEAKLKDKKWVCFLELRPNQCDKCLHIAITFEQNELERPGWAQIIAYETCFSNLKYFLKIDSLEAKPFVYN